MYNNVRFLNSLNKILQFDDKVKKYTESALNYFDSPWQNVIYDLVFKPVGDMNKMSAVGNNPNKINYSIIIQSIILKESTLNQFSINDKKSRINTSYSINEPSCCEDNTESCCGCKIVSKKNGLFGDCGFGLPIFIGWDHGSNSCQTSLYPGWYKTKKPLPESVLYEAHPCQFLYCCSGGKSSIQPLWSYLNKTVFKQMQEHKRAIGGFKGRKS